jgi:hypothetical protein
VSKKTSILLTGSHLEDGREVQAGRKYKAATENKVTQIMDEAAFYAMIETSRSPSLPPSLPSTAPAAPPPPPTYTPGRPPSLPPSAPPSPSSDLWTSKYAPQHMHELIGGGALAQKLGHWLQTWDDVHRHKTKQVPFSNGKENLGAKAALLSGPPGWVVGGREGGREGGRAGLSLRA